MAEHAADAVLTAAELAQVRAVVNDGEAYHVGARLPAHLIEHLLATVEAYREIVAAVAELLREHREWNRYCPICDDTPERLEGETTYTVHHEPGCLVLRARALLGE